MNFASWCMGQHFSGWGQLEQIPQAGAYMTYKHKGQCGRVSKVKTIR